MKALFAAVVLLGSAVQGFSSIATFDGHDVGAEVDSPRPNSDAAAAAFDSSATTLGTLELITFEGLAIGQFSSMEVAPGVVASQTGHDPGLGGIATASYITNPSGAPVGYNITPGGTKFLGFVPQFGIGTATLEFTFSTPLQAWGAYIVGMESNTAGSVMVQFDDGSSHSYSLTDMSPAGVEFFGFTDPGRSIVKVSLVETGISGSRDIYGIDDIRYVEVPEPATLGLLALGALATIRRRRRSIHS